MLAASDEKRYSHPFCRMARTCECIPVTSERSISELTPWIGDVISTLGRAARAIHAACGGSIGGGDGDVGLVGCDDDDDVAAAAAAAAVAVAAAAAEVPAAAAAAAAGATAAADDDEQEAAGGGSRTAPLGTSGDASMAAWARAAAAGSPCPCAPGPPIAPPG